MELKLEFAKADGENIKCSNRTFMELKWVLNAIRMTKNISSNRTFMELKLEIFFFVNIVFSF